MSIQDRGFRVLLGVFITAIILSIFGLLYGITEAQDTVHTYFSSECIEALSPVHYRLHYGYWSSGVETFEVTTDATLSIGSTVTTEAGYHFLGYLDAYSPDSPKDFTVTFTGANDTHVLHLNTWTVTTPCEVSTVAPDATPEPPSETIVDVCPAWAINGATGERYCMWSLPKVGDWQ